MTQSKLKIWINWSLLSLLIVPLSYLVSLIVVLLVHGAFGYNQMEGGTYLSQTVMQVAGGAVIGLGTGLYQRALLTKIFQVPVSWIYNLVISFAVTELIVCIVLWQMGINRYELRFIEHNPLPEVPIFAFAGLLTGIMQWLTLRKYFSYSGLWIAASTVGWGLCILITVTGIFAFFIGALLYGIITGLTITLITKNRYADNIP